MRMSCNGCRVLRKGCSEDCIIRPCLLWIGDPESEGNATLFLAKFYGRAGLLNLISQGSEERRPAIFRSLLYEACGRFVNPIYGAVGLLWEGKWSLCQAAVDAVLKGAPLTQISSDAISTPPFLKSYDIRHCKNSKNLHKLQNSSLPRFKRASNSPNREESNVSVSSGTTSLSMESEKAEEGEVGLELSLGLEKVRHCSGWSRSESLERESGKEGLGLSLSLLP